LSSPAKRPSTATYALLGLLAVRSWTGYELAGQAHRSLRYIWPTSEAHLYREQKRLVRLGWATADSELVGRRPRTRYSITAQGRAALREWAETEPGAPGFEVEGIVRTFFCDMGSVDALASSMRSTSRQARERIDDLLGFVEEYLETGGAFPDRLHVVALALEVVTDLLGTVETYFERTAHEVERWDTAEGRGLDSATRARLEAIRQRHRRHVAAPSAAGRSDDGD
jgi:PadR family transcriptional regulator, regulatory protein AphA